jgi:dephospho-CoA kinase
MPILVMITGPIATGKNTVATLLADRFVDAGRSVVIADVDDVAMMVCARGLARRDSGSLRIRPTVRWLGSGCALMLMS